MRTTYKIKTWILGILAMVVLTYSCAKADEEFVHRTNTISQMICKASHGGVSSKALFMNIMQTMS